MAVTTDPTYPLAGEAITITQTLDSTGLAIERSALTLTAAPSNSALATGPVLDTLGDETNVFTPDVSGEYTLNVAGFIAYSAPVLGDVDNETEEVLATSDELTLHVGANMDLRIATLSGDAMTLRLGVFNGTVRTAELLLPTTQAATDAILNEDVQGALEDLLGVGTDEIGVSLDGSAVEDLATKYNAHRVIGTIHQPVDDLVNTFYPTAPRSTEDGIRQINMFREILTRHLLNSTTTVAGSRWHPEDDTKNVLLVGPATTHGEATVLYADCCRAYAAHIGETSDPASHLTADVTNTLATPDKLTALIKAVLAYFATTVPTPPTDAEVGKSDLANRYGFTEAA